MGLKIQPTPRAVIKEAFSANIIEDGQVFIDMLDARNLMSHRYDERTFNHIFLQITELFEPAIEKIYLKLKELA
ncbi:hypothetical protein FACS1894132_07680 [Clostridia bacterium]|nr:hypothetical protein FACS1894132_07680 [Clostridia bacterium]